MIRPGMILGLARAEARLTRRLVRYWLFVIVGFLVAIWIFAAIGKGLGWISLDMGTLLGDCLVRSGMNGLLVLALVLPVRAGNGLNFGLPLGIVCGLLGGMIATVAVGIVVVGMVGMVNSKR